MRKYQPKVLVLTWGYEKVSAKGFSFNLGSPREQTSKALITGFVLKSL